MIEINKNIDKAEIAELEPVLFGGRIITVLSASEAEKAVNWLETQDEVGIDTETRPSFAKGRVNKVALLQVSTRDTCFLFRLNMIGLTPAIIRFLQAEKPLKIGLSLKDDFSRLKQIGNFNPEGYVELQNYVSKMGIEAMSLQKIYALLFGRKISKSQRLSNWEADVLSDAQKAYAATDAWACINIYDKLEALRQSGDYKITENPASELPEDK
ncbi:MAG: 3'-5' exonuclease domain-containing protein 2 [Bacteroidaceae bacterium]|nr:3'-5' exonuclease domain-containing protein 2 [Bacteroidaceae bacterium]